MNRKLKVIGIGEILWDVLPEGKKLGGAPCNFVYHAQKHGTTALILSAVGDDDNGMEILELLKKKHISSELIQSNPWPTGTVDVLLSNNGIPKYTIHENVAWDFIDFNEAIKNKISKADIVCFGSLAQRNMVSKETIKKVLRYCKSDTLIVYDINLRQNYYNKAIIENSLQLCNILKMNEDELPVICNLLGIKAMNIKKQIMYLINNYNLKLVAYTKGKGGSLLMTPTEKSYVQTPKVDVKDTVGAGDSFTAAMIIGFANGEPLKELHLKAVRVSAFVCTHHGAMPDYN